MYQEYIVTVGEVKSYCPEINNEISSTLVERAILATEDTILRDSLGQEWADQIITQRSGGTYTTENAYIVNNFLKQLISFGVWEYLTTTLTYQLNSSGLRIKQSDHSISTEPKDLGYYKEFIQNYMDRVRKTMKLYINDHKSLYPLYYNNKYHDKPKDNVYDFRIGKV
jgi:hypothetical protein